MALPVGPGDQQAAIVGAEIEGGEQRRALGPPALLPPASASFQGRLRRFAAGTLARPGGRDVCPCKEGQTWSKRGARWGIV